MEEWFTSWKIPLGAWLTDTVNWFKGFAAEPIGVFSDALEGLMEASADALYWLPPLVLIVLIAALVYLIQRSWRLTAATVVSLIVIVNLGLWEATVQTVALIMYATVISMAIGIPLGIWTAHRARAWTAIRPILDLMQTIPTFVYLIPMLALFSLGYVPGLVATIVFALPAPVRLTYLGMTSVPRALIEAGESFGATKRQLLWKVELPHALPTIMAGVTQCIMLSLSMVVVAALVGTPGLGVSVVRALSSMNMKLGFESGLAIVVIAILLDRVCKQREPSGKEK